MRGTADEILQAHFEEPPSACPACGTIGELRVRTAPPYFRWASVQCVCGHPMHTVVPPDLVVPFGLQEGELLSDLSLRDVQWLHDAAMHPWLIVACCARVGCRRRDCAPTWSEYQAGIVPPSRAQRKAERAEYVKRRARQLRGNRP